MKNPVEVRDREELSRLGLPPEVTLAKVVYEEGAEPLVVSVYQNSGGNLRVGDLIVPNEVIIRLDG